MVMSLDFKNYNHFCNDVCYKLAGKMIPKWVIWLPKIGSASNLLPDALNVTAIRHDPICQLCESEKWRSRNNFSCLSSVLIRQKQVPHSHYCFILPREAVHCHSSKGLTMSP